MWFYSKNDEQQGPVEASAIRERLKSGELSNATLVWKEGMAQWTPLGEVLELREPAPEQVAEVEAVPEESPKSIPPVAAIPAPAQTAHVQPQLTAPVPQNTMALTSMILGIVSVVLCMGLLTGLPAIICGHIARKQFRQNPTPQAGQGMATAGLILGYIASILSLLVIVGYIVVFASAFSSGFSSGFESYSP